MPQNDHHVILSDKKLLVANKILMWLKKNCLY